MKRLILMMAFVIGLGAMANAQTAVKKEHKTPQQKAELMTKRLQKKLNLSDQQSKQVNSILLAQATKVDSLKAHKVKGEKKQNRQALRGVLKDTDTQLSAVLNADQKKAYAELKAAQKEKMKARKTQRAGASQSTQG